jgi:hypothetical protein
LAAIRFPNRFPPEGKVALPVLTAVVGKAQEVERLRFSFPALLPIVLGPAAELD